MTTDPFEDFQRAARRAVRDCVRSGMAPGLMCAVSIGAQTRALRTRMRLDLLPDARAVRDAVVEELDRNESRFGAVGRLKAHPDDMERAADWRVFLLSAFTFDQAQGWAVPVHPLHGLGAWERSEFRLGDLEPLQQQIADNAARRAL